MRVFLSWSGQTSKAIAEILRDWLPNVIQAIEPWLSSEDIRKGVRWNVELTTQLKTTDAGVICVTPDNQHAPWLNFEAGALAKAVDRSLVCPYLAGLEPTDLSGPLVDFQATVANEEDTY